MLLFNLRHTCTRFALSPCFEHLSGQTFLHGVKIQSVLIAFEEGELVSGGASKFLATLGVSRSLEGHGG